MMNNEHIENMDAMELELDNLEGVTGGKGSANFVKTTGNVHVRKGPGLDYAEMGTVEKGAVISYLGEARKDERGVKWYKVNYNGKVGWISSKYAKLI